MGLDRSPAGPNIATPRRGLASWAFSDTAACCAGLRTCTAGATSVEVAAQRIVGYLRSTVPDDSGERSAFALARLFKTDELQHLPAELRSYAGQRFGDLPPDPAGRWLALLATEGDLPQWCDRRRSVHHQLIPVCTPARIRKAPMVSALVQQLGLSLDAVAHGGTEQDATRAGFEVFHVQHAQGAASVPDQDFVTEHGIRSVLGFGGIMPSGHIFAVVLFSRVEITPEIARLFRIVALSVKLALLPYSTAPLFEGQGERPVSPLLAANANISVLEQMLTAYERTAIEQAAALEESLRLLHASEARLLREAEIIETLRDVGESLSSVLDVDAVVDQTTRAAVAVTGAELGAFFYNVTDAAGESFMLYKLAGVPSSTFEAFPMPRNTEVFGPTFRGEGVVHSDDITRDPRYGRSAPFHGMPAGHPPVRSYLAAPVVSPTTGDVLGGLFLGHAEPDVFDTRAERLLVGIAAQTAIALDNATLYRRERQTALELQRALLPDGMPEPHADVDIAHRYSPGTAGLHVGGDWYDVIELPRGRTALVIGDVMGRGVRAAATMGQLRTSIRAFAALDLPPRDIAAQLNRIVSDLPDEQIATFVYAVFDPRTRALRLTNAGHPPPVLVSTDLVATTTPSDLGPPLGVPDATYLEYAVDVAPGEAVALYTDGLVENRRRPVDEGIVELVHVLTGLDARPDEICDKLLSTLPESEDDDDVAILYARFA